MNLDDDTHRALELLDYAPSGLFVLDNTLRVLFWNKTMETWTGLPRHTILGSIITATYTRLTLPQFAQPIQKMMETGDPIIFPASKYQYLIPIILPESQDQQLQHSQANLIPLGEDHIPLALFSLQDVSSSLYALASQEETLMQLRREMKVREQAQHTLDEERHFLQNVLDGVQDPIKVIDSNYQVLMMNRAAMQNVSSGSTMTCHSINYGRTTPCNGEHMCPVRRVIGSRKSTQITHEMYVNDTEKRFFETKASPLFRDDGSVWGIIEVSRDITIRLEMEHKLRESEAKQRELAHHDALTGLPNRLMLVDRLNQALPKADRHHHKIALLFLDLDKFKEINDTMGHDVGDEVLRIVAERLKDCLRESDTVARLGGDEFVVILDEIIHKSEVGVVCRKILENLNHSVILGEHEITTSTSLGVSIYPDDSQNVEGLLKCADSAMYRAKEQGRNNFQMFEQEMHATDFDRILMENSLRQAVDRGEIFLHYQPLINIHSGELTGIEALARWKSPDGKMVPPTTFIPVAEESGLIIPIGNWILHEGCRQNKKWQDQGGQALPLSINLSTRQFKQHNLIEKVDTTLQKTGLLPRYLRLEITESCIMADQGDALNILNHFTEQGISIAIDDFGTGYSSLRALQKLPLHMLKIDHEFVHTISKKEANHTIAQAIIALAHHLNLTVLAEGVENKNQHEFLHINGCDQAQGYLYGRPVSAKKFARKYLGLKVGG